MKRLLVVFLVLLFLGCSMPINNNWYDLKEVPIELRNGYINENDICIYVLKEVEYQLYANGFRPAEITLARKTGNCANITLLTIALIYKIKNVKCQLVYCYADNKIGKKGLHYASMINGRILDNIVIKEIYEVIEFDDIAEYIYYRQ